MPLLRFPTRRVARRWLPAGAAVLLALGSFAAGAWVERSFPGLLPLVATRSEADQFDQAKVQQAARVIRANYYDAAVGGRQLSSASVRGMVGSLDDPFSQYLTPEQNRSRQDAFAGQHDGVIGVTVTGEQGYPVVAGVLPNSPALRAGLQTGDVILRIDGADAQGLTPDQTSALIRGADGTRVTLLVGRQRLRGVNFQGDALRLGMNWTEEDLDKPQVLVDSAYGMGHPGTFHFRQLVEEVSNGVYEAGGKPAEFAVSDICDGVVQATGGMSYSLVSRDIMAAMVEIHALGHPHDGMVLVSGNDKSVPAHLMAIARCDLPAIHLPGGTQLNAPDSVTSDLMWWKGAEVQRSAMARDDLELAQRGACPTCGACQFMGSASTGQVLAEALGLALPGSALTPAPLAKLLRYARATGKQVVRLIEEDLTPRRILSRQAFENAIVLHAATGGSTNALLHLPAIAHEAGVEVTIDDFDRIHRQVPVLANVKTTGRYPVEYFWYAGGVPALMLELRDLLHLDCLTVTGRTLGENLERIEQDRSFLGERLGYLRNVKVQRSEIIRPRADAFASNGGVAILRGNLAPDGAMVKTFSVPTEMHVHVGPARVYEHEDDAVKSLVDREVTPGDVIVIRYEGPRANGMPEMYFASAILSSDPALNTTTALITDGRYSGAMNGPCIGHVTPEALLGGPIALVEDNDLIEVNIAERRLDVVGVNGQRLQPNEVLRVLAERRRYWSPPPSRHDSGILAMYERVARGAAHGASMT
ncbi:MAG TPA: dihydroxy-acid dehydratase [Candidatus Dormibacteraeota bacterium]|nr:dihydroxy-acid dehydratase [Candidatus Dormibacteraeota bacterium]